MAVEIKSGAGSDLSTVDPISKAIRVTNYNSAGVEIVQSLPVSIAVSPVTASNTDIIPTLDVSAYKFVSLQLTGTWSGTVQCQGSNDNGTFYTVTVQDPTVIAAPYVTSLTANGLVKIPVLFKYLRVRVTAYVSGSVTGTAFGYKEDNVTGQISATGTVSLNAETTKVIGTVSLSANTAVALSANTSVALASGSTVGLAAGSAVIGTVKVISAAASGVQYQKFISTTGLNATLVKAAPANLQILHIVNGAATQRFFKLYNKASAPIVGTDIPIITVTLAPSAASNFTLPALTGIDFSVGLSFAVTLGVADNDITPFTVVGEVTAMIAYV